MIRGSLNIKFRYYRSLEGATFVTFDDTWQSLRETASFSFFFRRSAESAHTKKQGGRLSREPKLSFLDGIDSLLAVTWEILSILVGRGDKILRKIPRICLSKFLRKKSFGPSGGVSTVFREVSTPFFYFFFTSRQVFRPRTKVYNIIPPVRFKRGRIPRGKWQTAVLPLLVGGIIAFMTYFTWKGISLRMRRRLRSSISVNEHAAQEYLAVWSHDSYLIRKNFNFTS